MKIYFEYVLIDNIIINFLILLCVAKTLHFNHKNWLLFISSIFGAVVALLLPLINLSQLMLLPLKLISGIIMLLIAFKIKSFKSFIIAFVAFLSFTFLMGGACMGLLLIFGTSINELSLSGYDASVPLGVMLGIISIYVAITIELSKYIYKRRDALQFIGKVKLELNGKQVEFTGFIDSGNRLFDNVTGLPVIIVSSKVLKQILSAEMLTEIYFNKGDSKKLKNAHFIQFATLSGESKPMLVFKPSKCYFSYKGKVVLSNVMVGVTTKSFSDVASYDALLHPSMLI